MADFSDPDRRARQRQRDSSAAANWVAVRQELTRALERPLVLMRRRGVGDVFGAPLGLSLERRKGHPSNQHHPGGEERPVPAESGARRGIACHGAGFGAKHRISRTQWIGAEHLHDLPSDQVTPSASAGEPPCGGTAAGCLVMQRRPRRCGRLDREEAGYTATSGTSPFVSNSGSVASRISSTETPGARSSSRNPSGVTSITASEVTSLFLSSRAAARPPVLQRESRRSGCRILRGCRDTDRARSELQGRRPSVVSLSWLYNDCTCE